ncbi:MAG TPA: ATP-binding protein [Rhizomicrobium sp.]
MTEPLSIAPSVPAAASVPSQRWLALVEAVQQLAAAETLDDAIDVVRSKAREISGADGVTFVLRDGDNCHYVDENAIGPLWKGKRFPLTACISGWCMLNDKMAAISDIYLDQRIPHDAYRPTFVNSLVMVPVRTTHAIAAIGSYWRERRAFGAEELALIEALARSTAVAISSLQMRASLREGEERLRMALAAGDLGAWEFSLPDRVLTASRLCRAGFGRDDDKPFRGSDFFEAVDPADAPRLDDAFDRAAEGSADLSLELRVRRPDGGLHWLELRGRARRDASGAPVAVSGVLRDITQQHGAKERIHKLQSDLAHAGRLTELGEMVSALGHEIRQPLTATSNYLTAVKLKLRGTENSGAEALVEKALGQIGRAREILDRIRDFARKGDSQTNPEDIGALISEASELAKLDPRHREVDIEVDAADSLPKVLVEKVPTQQVLLNLLRNAFEATETSHVRRVRVRADRSHTPDEIEITVADTGPGIAPEVMAKLFQPFVTTKSDGMGIGLSICHSIVEAQGGKMWAKSEPGRGAQFFLTLPVVPQAA